MSLYSKTFTICKDFKINVRTYSSKKELESDQYLWTHRVYCDPEKTPEESLCPINNYYRIPVVLVPKNGRTVGFHIYIKISDFSLYNQIVESYMANEIWDELNKKKWFRKEIFNYNKDKFLKLIANKKTA